jgi:hypothetical protein
MKDFIKFVGIMLLFAPCMLIVNENQDCLWLNVLGIAYLFCVIGYCVGSRRAVDRMLKDIERYERELLKDR